MKNKTWLLAFLGTVAAFVYQILGLADIVPAIGEDLTVQLIGIAVNLLVTLGIVQDPRRRWNILVLRIIAGCINMLELPG